MLTNLSERKEAWKTVFIFLVLVFALTSPFHYAIVKLYPSRIYVGAIMWCPAIAAIITLKIKGRSISELNWEWGKWKYIRLSYLIPAIYAIITYGLIWIFGLGRLASEENNFGMGRRNRPNRNRNNESVCICNYRCAIVRLYWGNQSIGNHFRGRNWLERVFLSMN